MGEDSGVGHRRDTRRSRDGRKPDSAAQRLTTPPGVIGVAEGDTGSIVARMRGLHVSHYIALLLGLGAAFSLSLSGDDATGPTRVAVPAMKTSIYVGSVTLKTTTFERSADSWSATYDARVFPWAFWSEHGEIAITLAEADLDRLARGETVNFTGDARNHKGKPRAVTGRAEPVGSKDGRIKVRIRVDDVELVFNGHYTLDPAP